MNIKTKKELYKSLVLALGLSTSISLSGCDNIKNLLDNTPINLILRETNDLDVSNNTINDSDVLVENKIEETENLTVSDNAVDNSNIQVENAIEENIELKEEISVDIEKEDEECVSLSISNDDFSIYCGKNYMSIREKSSDKQSTTNISDEYYSMINNFINENRTNHFSYETGISNIIDINKINLDNIDALSLYLENQDKNVDLKPLMNKKYRELDLRVNDKTNFNNVLNFLSSLDLNNTYLRLHILDSTSKEVSQSYVDLLSCFDEVDKLSLLVYNNAKDIDLSNLKSKRVSLSVFNNELDTIDFEINLNENIYDFDLTFFFDDQPKKLKRINVISENEELFTNLSIKNNIKDDIIPIELLDNAEIILPNNSYLYSENIDVIKINPIKIPTLKNIGVFINLNTNTHNGNIVHINNYNYESAPDAVTDFYLRQTKTNPNVTVNTIIHK